MKCRLTNPIPLPIEQMAPPPELFTHPSTLHGQAHTARVIIHTLILLEVTGLQELAAPAWAAAYIHDIGRRHDGRCADHGSYALEKVATLPEVKDLIARGGVEQRHWDPIVTMVENHCRPELPPDHPHWRHTAILKDADGLDRVRIHDLNPEFLRFPQSRALIPFAETLYCRTNTTLPPGPGYFARLWPIAQKLLIEQHLRRPT